MFNINYFRGNPNEYVIQYGGGRIRRQGQALAFFYFPFNTTIVTVPTTSVDANFAFTEVTRDFQSVTIQGQLSYRIAEPVRAAAMLNFTIDPRRRTYLATDPTLLPGRITNIVQKATRGEIQSRSLEEALAATEQIAASVQAVAKASGELDPVGVELLAVYFQSSRPTPEVGKALEARFREVLLRRADEAIYARRAAAVEDERRIKENELATDITLEQQREQLVSLQGKNNEQEAEFRGRAHEVEAAFRTRALEQELALYREIEPRGLLALGFNKLGENASRIGNLTITSEILAALLGTAGQEKAD